ncbi:MAG TPA: type II secretion system protein [Lysobacter sp.]|nr:type II secretion system protein [Lysobacter sp.]
MTTTRKRLAGFTLLETIVTLVIVSLLVTVLMQALNQTLALRARLFRHQEQARVVLLQEAWFRDTVSTALIDIPELGRMRGTADVLEMVCARPLVSQGPGRIEWRLARTAGGLALHYRDERSGDIAVIPGPLHDARFSYLDSAGQWHDEWKPAADAAEQLPRLVRLEARTTGGSLSWWVPIIAEGVLPHNLRRNASGVY